MHEDTGLDFASRVDGDDARLRARHPHGDARRRRQAAGRRTATSSPGACCSCSSPARRATTAPASCSRRACSTCPPLADGTPSPVTGAFALHITSALPSGWLSSRGGSIMASADRLTITVTGKGGHASEPHRAIDPIPVACEIVQALQTDGHPHGRRVRPVGRHRRADHRRHDEQRHPRDGRDRGHDPRRQRDDAGAGPRRHPPRRRRHRRRPRLRGRGRHRAAAIRSRSTTTTSPTSSSTSPGSSSAPTRSCASRTR